MEGNGAWKGMVLGWWSCIGVLEGMVWGMFHGRWCTEGSA